MGTRSLKTGLFLVVLLGAVGLSHSDDATCEITAVTNCAGKSTDLVSAVASVEIQEICRTHDIYRACLLANSEYCNQDFVSGRVNRVCQGRCGSCGGVGGVSPSLLTMAVVGVMGLAILKFGG